jgi:hypothetical protein
MTIPPDYDRPPVFRRWSSWYAIVLGLLVVQIIIYYVITV